MNRRGFLAALGGIGGLALLQMTSSNLYANKSDAPGKFVLTEEEWRKRLTPAQFDVLREEGTEKPGSSPLLHEKREGTYVCVACDNPLFDSSTKYDSGTGWPSFFDKLPGAFETKRDYKLIWPRTEYHCARCGGHHGHVFDDGPQPTGLRYCNNGVALKFIPKSA